MVKNLETNNGRSERKKLFSFVKKQNASRIVKRKEEEKGEQRSLSHSLPTETNDEIIKI